MSWLCQALWSHGDTEAGDAEGGQEASAEKEPLELDLEGQGDCHVDRVEKAVPDGGSSLDQSAEK